MIDIGNGVMLVTRAEWGARRPRSVTGLSSTTNTDHWEGPHMGSFPHSSCAGKVRQIQNFHMDSRGWSDIAYNSISCPHGYVFEGRGRGVRSAANGTTAGNSGSFADCYLGGEGDLFTEAGKRAKRQAGLWLTGRLTPRRCHRDWKPTACPGDTICSWTHAGQPVDNAPGPDPGPDPTPDTEDDLMRHQTIAVSKAAEQDETHHRYWAVIKPGQIMYAVDWPINDAAGNPIPLYNDAAAKDAPEVRIDSAGFWAGLYGGQWTPPQHLEATLAGPLSPAESAALYDAIAWVVCWTAATTIARAV